MDAKTQKPLPIKQARLLIDRLERLPPDSNWARRASGHRGTLLRLLEQLESQVTRSPAPPTDRTIISDNDVQMLKDTIEQGYLLLNKAAHAKKAGRS